MSIVFGPKPENLPIPQYDGRQKSGHESDTDGRHRIPPSLPGGVPVSCRGGPARRHSGSVLVTTVMGFKRIGLAFAALVVIGLGAIGVSSFLISTDPAREAVQAQILSSPAYWDHAGGQAGTFARNLYLNVLSRDPALAEIQNWVNRLIVLHHETRYAVAMLGFCKEGLARARFGLDDAVRIERAGNSDIDRRARIEALQALRQMLDLPRPGEISF